MNALATGRLDEIFGKVRESKRLTLEDGLALYESPDIHSLGEMADFARRRLHGRRAYYNVNRHINYTNYCVLRCRFCSFYRPYSQPSSEDPSHSPSSSPGGDVEDREPGHTQTGRGGYELSLEQIVDLARSAQAAGASEVHIVGGLHPRLSFEYYLQMCRGIRQACPRLHIKAFTAVEIVHFTRISRPRKTIREVLEALREAGLNSLPGGGAEIFDERVHAEAFRSKVGEAGWFDVHRTAHELGIFSNATMLYGHVESRAERLGHLIKLREHQDVSLRERTAHFNCVIPLSFIPEGSELARLPGPSGLDDLRTAAVCRLMLDNFPHVKAFWPMLSPKLAQVSLNWGADDLDGTVIHYDVTRREGGGTTHQELTVHQIQRLIREAGCIPVERDSLYQTIN